MDYKKLHEDTLKGLRALVSEGKITEETARKICSDFKVESEDERMRKEIIDYFSDPEDVKVVPTATFNEWRNWLESRKEQKPEEIKVVYPDNPKRKEIGFYYNQKEVSWEDILLADRMHDYPYYFYNGMDYYPFMPEQKPAEWSEEDDLALEDSISNWLHSNDCDGFDKYGNVYVSMSNLRELVKFFTQPKQEWSEEDKNYMEEIISNLKYAAKNRRTCSNGLADECIHWLEAKVKSLRPQPKGIYKTAIENILEMCESCRLSDMSKKDMMDFWASIKVRCKDAIQSASTVDGHYCKPGDNDMNPIYPPINHWKPSEEQMGALNYAYCELFKKADVCHNILNPLQNLIDTLSKL